MVKNYASLWMDSSPDHILFFRYGSDKPSENIILEVNQTLSDSCALFSDKVTGKEILVFFQQVFAPQNYNWQAYIEECRQKQNSFIHEVFCERTKKWYKLILQNLENDIFSCQLHDISSLKIKEELLTYNYLHLHNLNELNDMPTFTLDAALKYVSFNEAHRDAMKMLYGAQIELGRSALGYFSDNRDMSRIKDALHRCLTGEKFFLEGSFGENKFLWRFYESIYSPIKDEKGVVVGVSVLGKDVTVTKRTEQLMSILAEDFYALGEDAMDFFTRNMASFFQVDYAFIATIDSVSNMVRTLSVFAKGTNADNIEYPLAGAPCYQVITGGDCFYPDKLQDLFPEDTLIKDLGVQSYWGAPLHDSKGKVIGLIGIMDATVMPSDFSALSLLKSFVSRISSELEKKNTQVRLEKSLKLFNDVTEASGEYVWEVDLEGRFTFLSEKAEDILGHKLEELLGRKYIEFIEPKYQNTEEQFILNLRNRPCSFKQKMHYYLNARQERITLMANGMPVYDANNVLSGFRGATKDVSELMKTREKLSVLNKELVELNTNLELRVQEQVQESRRKDLLLSRQARLAAMGEMISNIAHQWRQPLNALGLMIFDIAESKKYHELTEDYLRDSVAEMNKVIQYMSQTIDDFRYFFREEKNALPFSVSDVVKKTLGILSASMQQESLKVKIQAEPNLCVCSFPNELSQVILNITNNARDAFKMGDVSPKILNISVFKRRKNVVISIADNAGGIPEQIIERIFEPYFSTKTEKQGTGIGLYMAKMAVEKNMGGKIKAFNRNGGAVFEIELHLQL